MVEEREPFRRWNFGHFSNEGIDGNAGVSSISLRAHTARVGTTVLGVCVFVFVLVEPFLIRSNFFNPWRLFGVADLGAGLLGL